MAPITWRCDILTPALCLQLQSEWTELSASASEPNFFQSHLFTLNSIALFAENIPQIVTIRENGVLIGIVLLRRDIGYGKLPVPFFRSALHQEQYLGTPLVRAGFEAAFAQGLCHWLDQAPLGYCFLQLSMIGADGAIADAISSFCEKDRRATLKANYFQRAAIAPAAHKGLQADDMLRPSRRKNIHKAIKRLQEAGAVSFDRLSEPAQLDDWIADFLAMENTGWKNAGQSSILSSAHETALYRALIVSAFEAGYLNFTRLCLDGQPIAYTLDVAEPPAAFCLKSAIDQKYRKFSPGVLMEYETLRHYLGREEFLLVDSCSAPDNSMLNEMWSGRKAIQDLVIARKGMGYGMIFRAVKQIKSRLAAKSAI